MLTVALYPYQDAAVDMFLERGNLLVAYEMGLGKTVIALAAIEELLGSDEIEQAVIVVPASLKHQWAKQIASRTDVERTVLRVKGEEIIVPTDQHCVIIDGSPSKRTEQYRYIKSHRPEYVILGYENVVNDWPFVSQIKPDMIVLDEATAIKTFRAQRTKKIKRFNAPYRLALTGTPVENRPEELFSIMQWVDDEVLGRYDLFDRSFIVRNQFGGVQRYKNLPVLHERLNQAMSRKTRLDDEVRPYLPEVDEDVWYVKADARSARLYKRIAEDLLNELSTLQTVGGSFDLFSHYHGHRDDDDNSAAGRVMARQQAMEMLLDHPELLRRSADKYLGETGEGSSYAAELLLEGALEGLTSTPKMDLVVDEVTDILDSHPDNKVIIFSVYRDMSEILAEALHTYGSVRFHGQMSSSEKAEALSRFENDPDCRLFLSSHAGGYGVDLFKANHLINYDLAWSAGKQDQINARHVRASSRFDNVFIHNVLVRGSVEQRRFDMLALKRRVAGAIMDNRGSDDNGRVENDLASLSGFLRETGI